MFTDPNCPYCHKFSRLAVLFLATATHATLGKLMYAYGWPRGTPHTLAEIEAAAQWMYYGGDLAEILLAIAFFFLWFRPHRVRSPLHLANPWDNRNRQTA